MNEKKKRGPKPKPELKPVPSLPELKPLPQPVPALDIIAPRLWLLVHPLSTKIRHGAYPFWDRSIPFHKKEKKEEK